jgi:class 3 adenylate cyclase
MASTRRLAPILAADVAGHSRLMGADEEGTLAELRAIRRELSDPKVEEHRGRIVKTTGCGLLIEFASVVDAMRCAVEVQRAMAERNADVPQLARSTMPTRNGSGIEATESLAEKSVWWSFRYSFGIAPVSGSGVCAAVSGTGHPIEIREPSRAAAP